MPVRKRAWNRYESSILLEGYLEVVAGTSSKKQIIKRVSEDLRTMARNQGEEVDEVFRNETGIKLQLESMESAWEGRTVSIHASKMFIEIVDIYRNNNTEYQRILKEAKAMIAHNKSCEKDFMEYLATKVSPAQLSELYWCYAEIEKICTGQKILTKPLFETTDVETVYQVQKTLERHASSRYGGGRQSGKLISAGKYYYIYIRDEYNRDGVKSNEIEKNANTFQNPSSEEKTTEPGSGREMQEKTSALIKAVQAILDIQLERNLRDALREANLGEKAGVTIIYLMNAANCSDRVKVETILKKATWAKCLNDMYYFVEEEGKEIKTSDEEEANVEANVNERKVETILMRTEEDTKIYDRCPIIYKRIFFALKEASNADEKGLTIDSIYEKISRIGRKADIESILRSVSWAISSGGKYYFSEELVKHDSPERDEKPADIKVVDAKRQNDRSISSVNKVTFNDYLINTKKMTRAMAEKYCSAVEACEGFAKAHGHKSCSLYTIRIWEVRATVAELYSNPDFETYNAGWRIELKDVISELMSFIEMIVKINGLPEIDAENEKVINQESFYTYLIKEHHLAQTTARSYSIVIGSCERFAREHHYGSWKLYTPDLKEIRKTADALFSDRAFLSYNDSCHNQPKAAIEKLLLFISGEHGAVDTGEIKPIGEVKAEEKKNQRYRNPLFESVLEKHFKWGFRLNSTLEVRKFRNLYAKMHGVELGSSDDDITRKIRQLCIVHDDKAYLPDVMLSPELKLELMSYIKKSFENGREALYYSAIFSEFNQKLLDSHIYDASMLKTYLTFVNIGDYYIHPQYISKEYTVTIDPVDEVRNCLIEHDAPMRYEEIFAELSHLPSSRIRSILNSGNEFILNSRGIYFHVSMAHLTDEEMENIALLIDQAIEEEEYISGSELYKAIQTKYPDILERNSQITERGFRAVLGYKLGDRFSFVGKVISRTGQELSMTNIFANYAKNHSSFSLDELRILAEELDTSIYFEAVYKNSLRISENQFVSKDRAEFSIEDTDRAIDLYCKGEYIAIGEITYFGAFPDAGFPWNSFLLEHYVFEYSYKYKLLHSGFNRTSCVGAIVKKSAGISSFEELLIVVLANNDVDLERQNALKFLCEEGYLARQKFSDDFENILLKAREIRNRKEAE